MTNTSAISVSGGRTITMQEVFEGESVSTIQERAEIMALANLLTERRKELIQTIGLLNPLITALVQKADDLLPAAASELAEGIKPIATYAVKNPSPQDIADITAPNRRHCSLCGKPGHDARTCMEGRPETPVEKEKKTRAPLTEEQKQKKRDILIKAREARANKRGAKK
jgi:hypothetical protein